MSAGSEDGPPPATPEVPPRAEPTESGAGEPEEDWATRFRYLLADFENYRKRVERDTDLARVRARNSVLRELLPLLEATERARGSLEHAPASDPIRRGVDLIAREFRNFMDREQVVPVAEVGARFDPSCHEAVGDTPPREDAPEGSIGTVVQQGYRVPTGVLRPAKVLIARAPPEAAEPKEAPPSTEPPEASPPEGADE